MYAYRKCDYGNKDLPLNPSTVFPTEDYTHGIKHQIILYRFFGLDQNVKDIGGSQLKPVTKRIGKEKFLQFK